MENRKLTLSHKPKTRWFECKLTSVFGYLNLNILAILMLTGLLISLSIKLGQIQADSEFIRDAEISKVDDFSNIKHLREDVVKIKEMYIENWINSRKVIDISAELKTETAKANKIADEPCNTKSVEALLTWARKIDKNFAELNNKLFDTFNKVELHLKRLDKSLAGKRYVLISADDFSG